MGFTLDQLLERTGVGEIAGHQFQKTAEPKQDDLLKLADRCRKAVEVPSEQGTATAAQALIEKTAAVEIIRQTLAEIRDIEGTPPEATKTASEMPKKAAFIKAALDEGYSPEQIAQFLDKATAAAIS